MTANLKNRFRPTFEALEDRQLLSAAPLSIAATLTHSAENYANFLKGAYQQYLGRTPDAAGLNAWVQGMRQGVTDEQVEASFIGSAEYIANHGGTGRNWVEGMYHDLLGRSPGAAEVDGWVAALDNGLPASRVAYGFAASAEREGIRVQADYQTYLGRSASPAEVKAWVDGFESGLRNEDVIAGFVGSDESFARAGGNANSAWWLCVAYEQILGRAPQTKNSSTG